MPRPESRGGWRRLAAVFAAGLLAAACARMGPRAPASSPPPADLAGPAWPPGTGAAGLLRYAGAVRRLPAGRLQRERTRAESALAKSGTPEARLRLALLLAVPDPPLRDDERARPLLQDYLREANGTAADSTSAREFAAFLLRTVSERDRQKAAYRELQESLAREHELSSTLRKQIDALKAIEKSIDANEPSAPTRSQ